MWKIRDLEKQSSCHSHTNRGHMHCDRLGSESRDRSGSQERSSGQDDREARYWSRKLYEFEANDPDRWGHSGFKELYPEEFRIEGEDDKKNKHWKKKKSSKEADKSKRSKKSSKKKKKKKDGKRKREEESSDSSRGEDSDSVRKKQKRKSSKSKHRRKRRESSSEDSDKDEGRGERTPAHGKRPRDSHKGSELGMEPLKKRRNNWKAPIEERSEGSSDD